MYIIHGKYRQQPILFEGEGNLLETRECSYRITWSIQVKGKTVLSEFPQNI